MARVKPYKVGLTCKPFSEACYHVSYKGSGRLASYLQIISVKSCLVPNTFHVLVQARKLVGIMTIALIMMCTSCLLLCLCYQRCTCSDGSRVSLTLAVCFCWSRSSRRTRTTPIPPASCRAELKQKYGRLPSAMLLLMKELEQEGPLFSAKPLSSVCAPQSLGAAGLAGSGVSCSSSVLDRAVVSEVDADSCTLLDLVR